MEILLPMRQYIEKWGRPEWKKEDLAPSYHWTEKRDKNPVQQSDHYWNFMFSAFAYAALPMLSYLCVRKWSDIRKNNCWAAFLKNTTTNCFTFTFRLLKARKGTIVNGLNSTGTWLYISQGWQKTAEIQPGRKSAAIRYTTLIYGRRVSLPECWKD
jgi:hypothetical protein